MNNRKRNKVISLELDQISFDGALRQVMNWAEGGVSSYVCFANVHMTVEAKQDPAFAEIVNAADLVCADGMPLAKAVNMLYKQPQERIAGMDFLPALLDRMQTEKSTLPLFFYGSTPEVLDALRKNLNERWPSVILAGMISPPFRQLNDDEQKVYLDEINHSGARLVFVGLGCPKQEKWMAKWHKSLDSVMLGVGGAFSTTAGLQKRAPGLMQKMGMEWFYRLIQEPKRLMKRYFVTNSIFLVSLIRALGKKN